MSALPRPPESTAEGFMAALMHSLCHRTVGPPAGQSCGALGAAPGNVGVACAASVRVGPDADARPAVLPDGAWRRLLGADDGDGADDGSVGEPLPEGLLNAHAVLDENDARLRAYERRDQLGVIAHVRKRLGGDDDVVPGPLRALPVRAGGGWDGGKSTIGVEGIVAEAARLQLDARLLNCGVVGAGNEGDVDVVRGLEHASYVMQPRRVKTSYGPSADEDHIDTAVRLGQSVAQHDGNPEDPLRRTPFATLKAHPESAMAAAATRFMHRGRRYITRRAPGFPFLTSHRLYAGVECVVLAMVRRFELLVLEVGNGLRSMARRGLAPTSKPPRVLKDPELEPMRCRAHHRRGPRGNATVAG
ncbi:hypothetical protein G7046_g9416 [Stylonectria norvegica]|nr:hypothetical protein G7046_g9416 [Stylonectria norvegica]